MFGPTVLNDCVFCPIRINISQHGLGPQAKVRNGHQLPASGFDHEDLIPIMISFVFQVGRPEEDLWRVDAGSRGNVMNLSPF